MQDSQPGLNVIGLLAAEGTMKAGLFQNVLADAEVETRIPK